MTSNSTQAASFYDNFVVCNPPAQVYIGGWVRTPAGTGTGVPLGDLACDPDERHDDDSVLADQLDQHCANGNTTPDIPAGTFNGGTLALATTSPPGRGSKTVTRSRTRTPPSSAAGTYTGRVTYTLALP